MSEAQQERLLSSLNALRQAILTHHFGRYAPIVPPLLAPTSRPLTTIVTTHQGLLFQLLSVTTRDLISHKVDLFPRYHPPSETLNRLLGTARQLDREEPPNELTERRLRNIRSVGTAVEMIEDGKARCSKYRKCWRFLGILLQFVDAAKEGGILLGIPRAEVDVWFWEEMERVTEVRELVALLEWTGLERLVG